jgi:multidrug efflux pump subunit AcrA (membrane-fusion protein)
MSTERAGRTWLNYFLSLLCVGAIVAAVLVVGPASGSQRAVTRTAKATQGVVQSTVSGSGSLQPASQLDLGFKTNGTVTGIDVTQGEHVTEGRLLAELDPSSAEVTLEQARANLLAAKATLSQEEETGGEPASRRSSTSAPSSTDTAPTGTATASSTLSTATREANLASARAAVKSDQLTVRTDEQALANTKLYAPGDGTIVTLSGQVGEVVSASGTTRASSGSSSSSSSSGSGSAAGGASSDRSATASTGATGSSGSSSSTSSSGTAFAVLSDLSSMRLVVALSESEIGSVKVGQIATATVEALGGRTPGGTGKLAAHVSEVATLSTSSSGVVSYDVTFQLDQMVGGLKPGMSATAEVVVKQAEGVSVPTSAISAGSVTVVRGGKDIRQRVVSGLAGNSSTIVLSGLKAGETVVLPAAIGTSSATSLTSRLGRLGGGGGGFGGGVLFRGGG